jgi:uncharacterized membrane protein
MGTFQFSDLDHQKTCRLGQFNPNFKNLAVVPGLNLKGKCGNKNCLSNTNKTYQTWIPKGFGNFNLSEGQF